MSRIFEALQRSSIDLRNGEPSSSTPSAKMPEIIAQMERDSHSPLEAATFTISPAPEKRLVAVTDRYALGAEKLRMLSARLKYLQNRRSLKKLLITSTIRGEGKTTVLANVGVILAQQRQKVLLIDGDVHQPALSELFGLASRPGLTDWWRQQHEISSFLCRAEGLPLWFLSAGTPLDQPLTMLHSTEIGQLIANISSWFDWVIIDSPPLAPLADASVWATIADAILLVCRQGMTPKRVLEQSLSAVERAKVLGVVLNYADSTEHRYYADYYRHASARSAGKASSQPRTASPPRHNV